MREKAFIQNQAADGIKPASRPGLRHMRDKYLSVHCR